MMNYNNKIGIVTVLYNSETVLEEYIQTLSNQSYTNFILYIINNASPDNSLSLIRSMTSRIPFKIVVFDEPENWGIAKGNNIGISAAINDGCDLVLLSNNDLVLESTAIENLLIGLYEHNASMATPKNYYWGTNMIWATTGSFNYIRGCTLHDGAQQEDKGQSEEPKFCKYTPTCFVLIKKEVFDRVGLMDENYFVYYDDTDFMYRATMRGTETIIYIPSSIVRHKESVCTGGNQSDFTIKALAKNSIYFIRKNLYFPQKQIALLYKYLHTTLRKPFVLNEFQLKLYKDATKDGYYMADRILNDK